MKKSFAALGTILAVGALTTLMALSVFAAQITEEKAKSIALEHAGVKAEDVAFIKSESDFEKGRLVYDIEFLTSDYKEYDYEIDTESGEILSYDYDAEYDFLGRDRQQGAGTASASITLEDAKATALNRAGLTARDVIWGKVEQDHDDGRIIYEGEFYYGSMEYEFEIDAATGTIIDWDVDWD